MNISLTLELEEFVESRVKSGHYQTTSEVMRAGLRLLIEQEEFREARLEELRTQIRIGLEQLDRGEGVSAEEVREELNRRRTGRTGKR